MQRREIPRQEYQQKADKFRKQRKDRTHKGIGNVKNKDIGEERQVATVESNSEINEKNGNKRQCSNLMEATEKIY